jgi:hypothetical protein
VAMQNAAGSAETGTWRTALGDKHSRPANEERKKFESCFHRVCPCDPPHAAKIVLANAEADRNVRAPLAILENREKGFTTDDMITRMGKIRVREIQLIPRVLSPLQPRGVQAICFKTQASNVKIYLDATPCQWGFEAARGRLIVSLADAVHPRRSSPPCPPASTRHLPESLQRRTSAVIASG